MSELQQADKVDQAAKISHPAQALITDLLIGAGLAILLLVILFFAGGGSNFIYIDF